MSKLVRDVPVVESTLKITDKYRPKKFSEVLGLGSRKEDLAYILSKKPFPSFIMFTGASGLGKSTLTRIVAKAMYCDKFRELGDCCDECPSCLEFNKYIESGKSDNLPYVREINASKDNGKASVEAIIEDAGFAATFGQQKIYFLDEAHQLTIPAQNALLKVLEEDLQEVTFIMGTTDPERLIPAIHTREQVKIHLSKPSAQEVQDRLEMICTKEGVPYDTNALAMIVYREGRGVRACDNALGQMILSGKEITLETVVAHYGELPMTTYIRFLHGLLQNNRADLITLLFQIKEKMDVRQFLIGLMNYVKTSIYIFYDAEIGYISKEDLKNIKPLIKAFTEDQLGKLLYFLNRMVLSSDIEAEFMQIIFQGLNDTVSVNPVAQTNNSELGSLLTHTNGAELLSTDSDKLIQKQIKMERYDDKVKLATDWANEITSEEISVDDFFK